MDAKLADRDDSAAQAAAQDASSRGQEANCKANLLEREEMRHRGTRS